jgi:anhydro-N-acetylmuramic acid kinase
VKVLGIMSGTSIDRMDYALCEVTERSVKLLKHWAREFPSSMRKRLHAAASNRCRVHEVAQLHHDLGRLFAAQAGELNSNAQLVGMHGQTVFHNPNRKAPATLQLGESAYLAEALRIPIVDNFRAADIAAGGQGAPLATLFHKIVFARRGQHVCVDNLGGISNVTSLDWRDGSEPRVVAFDTGPANVLLDLAMREFTTGKLDCDVNGAWAARGVANEELLARWLAHPFFKAGPPKSTGRELFGETFWRAEQWRIRALRLSRFDVLATLTEFTARSITLNYRLHLPSAPGTIILCGGGAKNPVLVRHIRTAFEKWKIPLRICRSSELGWPVEAIEPAAFALLAYYRLKKWPVNTPGTTGAQRAVLLGQITEGRSP